MALRIREQSNTELLQSHAHIWNHIFQFINSMSLKSAIQLEIPDIINKHGGPMTLSELTEALSPVNEEKKHCISRLMRILVHSGFFVKLKIPKVQEDKEEEEEEDGYSLTPASRLLLEDDSLSLRPFVLAMLDPVLVNPWHHLSEWFRNDDMTPFETFHGRTFWDNMGHDPIFSNLFNTGMGSDARFLSDVVIRDCPGVFKGLNSLVDVGGGTGTMAMAIANAFPLMNCTNFDLPYVIAGLEGSENLTHVEGDMFVAVPPADAVLLKWVLHDWSDVNCVKILKRCKEAIPSRENGGKVIIIDIIVGNTSGDEKSIESQLFFDMMMMVVASGRERNENEWAKLFIDAGFSDYQIVSSLGLRSLIEVYP